MYSTGQSLQYNLDVRFHLLLNWKQIKIFENVKITFDHKDEIIEDNRSCLIVTINVHEKHQHQSNSLPTFLFTMFLRI